MKLTKYRVTDLVKDHGTNLEVGDVILEKKDYGKNHELSIFNMKTGSWSGSVICKRIGYQESPENGA